MSISFYIYVCTPDEGLLAYIGKDPRGSFAVHHVKDVSGWIESLSVLG